MTNQTLGYLGQGDLKCPLYGDKVGGVADQ